MGILTDRLPGDVLTGGNTLNASGNPGEIRFLHA
jgi:hypothetical protein